MVAASVVGFLGNELVAVFRIRVGKEINSASLVVDGHHARVDGITSLGVLLSAIGIWLGYPLADPLVGLVITAAILYIVWDSIKTIFIRLLDGVDPNLIAEIRHTLSHVEDVLDVTDIRARWSGHELCTEVNLSVADNLPITEAHAVAVNAKNHFMLRFTSSLKTKSIRRPMDSFLLVRDFHKLEPPAPSEVEESNSYSND